MRTQTVVYNFPILNNLANNTLTNVGSITANFLGVNGVSIQNAFVIVKMDDTITATGGTITTKRIDLTVNGTTNTFSDSTTYSHTGQNIFWVLPFDVTSLVSAEFTSDKENTLELAILVNQTTGTTTGFVNVCVDLYITYQFDEINSDRVVKTAFIPISALTTALGTTTADYGRIPALNSYLPETNKVYNNITIVCEVNRSDSTSDTAITMEIPELSLLFTSQPSEGALYTGRRLVYNWKLNEQNFDVYNSYNFSAYASVAGIMYSPVFYLIVTYSYEINTTTTVLNSLLLGNVGGATGNSTLLFERVETELLISEPNVVAKRIMALFYFTSHAATSQVRLRIDPLATFSNPYTAFQPVSSSTRVHGIYSDTLTLNRGENNLILDYYTTDTYNPIGMNIIWIVNYISDAINGGVDNNRTIITSPIIDLSRPSRATYTTKISPLAELDYYITNGFFVLGTNTGDVSLNFSIGAEVLTSEGGDSGELTFIASSLPVYTDGEMGWKFTFYPFDFNKIKRFPGDISSNKMIEINYNRRLMVNARSFTSLLSYTTIHSVTKTISGVVKDSSGNPVNSANVLLIRLTSKPKIIKSTTSDSNGNYSFTVYDNLPVYMVYANKYGTPSIFDATDSNLAGN